MAKKNRRAIKALIQSEQQSSALSQVFRRRPETRWMTQDQTHGTNTIQPTENHVRMSRHRMIEHIVASIAGAVPRTAYAVLAALLLVWGWLQHYQ